MKATEDFKAYIDMVLIKGKMYRDPHFSAGQLAAALGIPAYKLSRVLRAAYGMSYADIVYTCRIQDAMRHLKDRRYAPYTVDDIGSIVGFSNRQSFFTAFKRITGQTPDQYRNSPA